MFDAAKIRQDFPLLVRHPNLSFLDSAASAQKPRAVLDTMESFQTHDYANIHRGLYALSQRATQAYEDARASVAGFINAPTADSIIFTRNTTEAINLVARSWAQANLQAGDAILLSQLEHHANIVPWQMLAEENSLEIQIADITEDGALLPEAIEAAMTEQTKLVAMTHMSNALGTIVPVADIIALSHARGAKVLVDGSQMVVHGPVDVQALQADFYCFTGHKLYGPTGIGALYVHPKILATMPPYQGGGDMVETVSFLKTTYAEPPARFEAGTPNITGAVGLQAAIGYMQQLNMPDLQQHETALTQQAIDGLSALKGVTLYGLAPPRSSIISFNIDGVHPSDVATLLDQCQVSCRSGHHCAMPLMTQLGVKGTVRASFAAYNTEKDVEKLVASIKKAREMLRG
jgi:cysteine desulfurase/selenocysteine lyase